MKNKTFLLLLALCGLWLTSCEKIKGEGPVVTQERDITGFSGIALYIPAQLTYTPGSAFTVKLEAQQNILDELESVKQGDKLLIRFRNEHANISTNVTIRITITAPDLERLEVHGSGDIRAVGNWEPFSAYLLVNGSGNITAEKIATGELEAKITGSGNIRINEGAVASQFLHISGSGEMELGNVTSHATEATISGSGDMKVYTDQLLDVKISGSGKLRYRGNPVVTSHISGSGTVSQW